MEQEEKSGFAMERSPWLTKCLSTAQGKFSVRPREGQRQRGKERGERADQKQSRKRRKVKERRKVEVEM